MARILFIDQEGTERLVFEGTQEEVVAKIEESSHLKSRVSDFRTVQSDNYPVRYEIKTFYEDKNLGVYRNHIFFIDLDKTIDTRKKDIVLTQQ